MADNMTGFQNTTFGPTKNNLSVNVTADENDGFQYWTIYLESVFIAFICIIGMLGNLIAIRNAIATIQFAKQNSILAFSLSISCFFICLVRGPSLIYVLHHHNVNNGSKVCEVWMFSTIFIILAIMTNMIVAIERYTIVNSFQGYVKRFTPRNMLLLFVSLWVGIAGLFTSVYLGLGFYSTANEELRSCEVRTDLLQLTWVGSLAISSAAVALFGLVPMLVLTYCYVTIVKKICMAGLLKLDKIEEKGNYTRVTYISCARAILLVLCWTPFLVFAVISPVYADLLVPIMRYVDYILIIESAVCPFLTMQDNDFKETFSRRKSRYFTVFASGKQRREIQPNQRSNISSADMKTL